MAQRRGPRLAWDAQLVFSIPQAHLPLVALPSCWNKNSPASRSLRTQACFVPFTGRGGNVPAVHLGDQVRIRPMVYVKVFSMLIALCGDPRPRQCHVLAPRDPSDPATPPTRKHRGRCRAGACGGKTISTVSIVSKDSTQSGRRGPGASLAPAGGPGSDSPAAVRRNDRRMGHAAPRRRGPQRTAPGRPGLKAHRSGSISSSLPSGTGLPFRPSGTGFGPQPEQRFIQRPG